MGKVGSVARIGSLAAMLAGAPLSGVLGERWHSRPTQPTDRDLALG
jgi:hypothetical protein